ncbi:DMT family transporter [Angustibacter sp. Root456]|uniref:EamA family transporter n=1 Tax=Angustibacter sp. Root456 TaxID=1736539 RepID=UPI0019108FD8|nr:DMT family transporter [Angustibacter sp. Root456]
MRNSSARAASGVAFAVAASVLFSLNATASKLVLQHGLTSIELVSLRSAGAAVLLLAFTAITRPRTLRVSRRELGFLAVYGICGIAMVQWLYFVALSRMPVGVALLLEYTAPLMVALWVRFARGEAVRSRVWAALALCLGGLALVAQVWDGLTLDGVGVLAGLGAAAALATYYLMGERGLGQRDPVSLMAWIFSFSALLWAAVVPWWSFPFEALTRPAPLPGGVDVPVGVLVAGIVLLGTVTSFGLVLLAVGRVGAARVGILGMLEPVGSGLVAWWVLSERLRPVQLLGAGVVLVGIVLAETARRRPPQATDAVPLPEGVAP